MKYATHGAMDAKQMKTDIALWQNGESRMRSEMCKRCIHHTVCMRDKNIIGDVFVAGHPDYFDNKKLFERFIEREKAGFPCDTFCGWIPCSERFPDKEDVYLCCSTTQDIWILRYMMPYYFQEGAFIEFDGDYPVEFSDVIAWMPLPEPYRGNNETT